MRGKDIKKRIRKWLEPFPYLVRVAREGSDKASGYSPTKMFRNPNYMRRRIMRNPDEIQESLIKHFGKEHREEIKETFSNEDGYSDWGESGTFEIDGQAHVWIKDEDEAERIAIDVVKQDLEDEPAMFNQDWLMEHIDDDNAESVMRGIYDEWNHSYATDIESEGSDEYVNRLAEEMVAYGMISEEEGKDEDFDFEDKIDEFVEKMTDSQIEEGDSGLEHYKVNFGDDALKKLILDNNLIDSDKATEDAVNIDGWAHFLSRYDGNYDSTKEGVVFFRE